MVIPQSLPQSLTSNGSQGTVLPQQVSCIIAIHDSSVSMIMADGTVHPVEQSIVIDGAIKTHKTHDWICVLGLESGLLIKMYTNDAESPLKSKKYDLD